MWHWARPRGGFQAELVALDEQFRSIPGAVLAALTALEICSSAGRQRKDFLSWGCSFSASIDGSLIPALLCIPISKMGIKQLCAPQFRDQPHCL